MLIECQRFRHRERRIFVIALVVLNHVITVTRIAVRTVNSRTGDRSQANVSTALKFMNLRKNFVRLTGKNVNCVFKRIILQPFAKLREKLFGYVTLMSQRATVFSLYILAITSTNGNYLRI